MIGPSSGVTAGNEPSSDDRAGRKRIFDELVDIDGFCDDVQGDRKRYPRYREIVETDPLDVIGSGRAARDDAAGGLFSPLSGQEAVVVEEECPVARLEVLLVDGTNCTWTTVSELEPPENVAEIAASPSASLEQQERRQRAMRVDEAGYVIHGSDYWESPLIAVPERERNRPNALPSADRQQQQLQQHYDDQETGNLSWLLDFKLDPFIEVSDDKSVVAPSPRDVHSGTKNRINGRAYGSSYANDVRKSYGDNNSSAQESSSTSSTSSSSSASSLSNQCSYASLDNRNFTSSRCNGPKKPPFTYTELIEHALKEKGELTVSAIYQWISEHFPYYKSNDDRWKNSVRHNLSINPHFRKGSKAPHGAGHLWAIANRSMDSRPRQIVDNGNAFNSSVKQVGKTSVVEIENSRKCISEMSPIDEVEAATASITQQPSTEDETESMVNSVTLEHCAEEILSGIKKEVEVQYLVPMMVPNNEHDSSQAAGAAQRTQELHYPVVKESDFLNPVSKEVVAEECGLISEGYLVTDLNPTTFGMNMIEPEIIVPDNLFGEELSFQFYELSSPSQIQSA